MKDEEVIQLIKITVRESIEEYKKSGLLKESENAVYSDATDMISEYFKNGKKDTRITYAIQGQRFDPYFRIIPMYFEEGKTIEKISEELSVDISTIVRNKKRLCLAIYNEVS
jgi:hypothetical protein